MTYTPHKWSYNRSNGFWANCTCGITQNTIEGAYAEHLLAALRRNNIEAECLEYCRLVHEVEDLDALPDGSIVRDADGEAWKRDGSCEIGEAWFKAGGECDYPSSRVRLPALVLLTPEAVTGG